MEENQVSRTATLTAIYRAYHSLYDAHKIFDDFMAVRLLKDEEFKSFRQQMVNTLRSYDPGFAASFPDDSAIMAFMMQSMAVTPLVLSRARYAEDYLARLVGQGVRQYIILGAGMDTFAFRRKELLNHLNVFEIDHPATQQFKLQRLFESGLEPPANLHFVPVDFTRENIKTVLSKVSSYNPEALSFFSWLGVTYYLPGEVVFSTLRSVAEVAPKGSVIVFDYFEPDAFDRQKAAQRVQMLLGLASQENEPMKAGFDPSSLAADLSKLGLRLEEDLSPSAIQKLYFEDRKDRYYACEHAHFAYAVVE